MVVEWLFLAILGVGWPIYDYFVDWPKFQRAVREHAARARVSFYRGTILFQWILTSIAMGLSLHACRSWSELGLQGLAGWRLGLSAVVALMLAAQYAIGATRLARSANTRSRIRDKTGNLATMLPHTVTEFAWSVPLSITAGICEEFLFRGYFPAVLAPWLGWWGAAALAAPAFGLLHAYQGLTGIVGTTLIGIVMAAVVAGTRSIVPAMVLHALIDLGSMTALWICYRDVGLVLSMGPPHLERLTASVTSSNKGD